MISYKLVPHDGHTEATHEIEVDWSGNDPHPPVLPVSTVISLDSDMSLWTVVQIRYFVNYDDPGRYAMSYLVKEGE